MPDEKAVQFDINAEINKFFDNSSLPEGGSPKFILIMGIPGAGKTTLRQDSFSK